MLLTAQTIVTGAELLRPGWIELAGDRILGAGAGPAPRRDAAALDLGAVTVVPGFVDTHVHGGGGADFAAATAGQVGTAAGFHLRHGTTTLIASLLSAAPDELLRQTAALAALVDDGLIAGIHLEGPWLAVGRCGAHDPALLRDPDPVELDRVLAAGGPAIRMLSLIHI